MVKIKFIKNCGFSFDSRIRDKVVVANRRGAGRSGYFVTTKDLKRVAPGEYGICGDDYKWFFKDDEVEVVGIAVESKRLRRQRKWDRKKEVTWC